MSENSRREHGGRFRPGSSGNPAGKPKGARNHATRAVQALLDGEAEELTRTAIKRAKEGDGVALRLCIERLCPPRRDAPVRFDLPEINSASSAVDAMVQILKAVADGDITPAQAQEVAGLIEAFRRTVETTELEARIAALEHAQEGIR